MELEQLEILNIVNRVIDEVQVSLFSHRFMSIAEQMGIILQTTALSVNCKERLDFSCAIFDSEGRLVANAPHLPVHLGSMSDCVKYQIEFYQSVNQRIKPNYAILTNHPIAGGSHLPDLTVISPFYLDASDLNPFM